jgi:hypothetical protein
MGDGNNVNVFETLEGRRLLSSATLSSGILKVTGNSSSTNNLGVSVSGTSLVASHNGATQSFSASSVTRIEITGGSSADKIWIKSDVTKPSVLRGNGGNDSLSGGGGRDTIYGGTGNDLAYGNNNNDSLRGEDGEDTLYGNSGTDTLSGDAGNDIRYDEQFSGGYSSDTGSAPAPSADPLAGESAGTGSDSGGGSTTGAVTDFRIASQTSTKVSFRYTYNSAGGTYTLLKNGASTGVTDTNGDVSISHTSGTALYQMRDSKGILSNSVSVSATGTTTPPPDDGGGSVPNDTSATAPTPVITARDTTISAGQSVFVHGTASSLGSGSPQNALYKWDFGDSGSEYNTLNGFNAAHTYANPGTYTIKLTLTNQAGKTNQKSITVTVASASRKQVYVSSSGSDSNSGTSSSPVRSFSKAASLAKTASNIEVLFRRGDTFDVSGGMDVEGSNVVIGAYGSGNKPVIRWTASVSGYPSIISAKGNEIAIQDLTFTSTTATPLAIRPTGNNLTIRNNQFLRLGYAINANGRPDGMLVQGNTAPDVGGIKSYFVWGEGTDHAYIDNTVANSREEHVIRVVGADRVLVWDNDLTNTTGQVSGDDTPKGALTLHKGSYYWVAQNNLNKGPVAIGPLGNGDGLNDTAARFRYGVFDGNVFDTKIAIDHGAERIMFRNNVIKSGDTAILLEGYNSSYGRTTVDVAIVNNTVINNNDGGRFIRVEKGASGVMLANNLYVAPNLYTGPGETASVYVEDSGLASFKFIDNNVWANASSSIWAQNGQNYVGTSAGVQSNYKDASEWNAMSGVGTDTFSDVAISSSYAPTSSTVVNATGDYFMGVFQDINGKVRDDWTVGAVEL